MKKIACVGYHATGAGVIDDLFREFDNVAQGHYEAESRILQDVDGISDLEFHLVECPNRLKTAVAIERFLRYAKTNRRMYEKIYGKKWLSMCKAYIESITKFRYEVYNLRAIMAQHPLAYYWYLICKSFNRLKPIQLRHPGWYNYFHGSKAYHADVSEEDFITLTQDFIEQLCNQIPHNENTEYVVIDQMIGGNYPERYLRYVKDLKVIVVDRDPRDLFIHMQIHHDEKLPKDPWQFCQIFKDIRQRKGIIDDSKVLYVSFEDMIYSYELMIKKVMDFVGISPEHHVAPRTHFDPTKSIRGTQLWKVYPQYTEAVKIIEKELPDYLHTY